MTHWIIGKSQGFTDVGLLRISESVRAHAYLVLSLQASARSHIIGNMASALTAQKDFLNNFKNVVNRKVDIGEDIKRYQNTPSYALSKVNYSMGEVFYMLPSDMNLDIKSGTDGYGNKILVSDSMFSLGENDKVNMPKKSNNKTTTDKTSISNVQAKHTSAIMHEDEKIALVLILTSAFGICLRLSLMRGTRQGNLIKSTSNFFLKRGIRQATLSECQTSIFFLKQGIRQAIP